MKKITKTNAARLLDQRHIPYQIIPYMVDENNLGATHIAEQLNEDIHQLFKTLVLRGDKIGIFVCVIPGCNELDLKKTAKATGNKSCDMVHMNELLSLTGYIRGGCSPIGMKKNYPTFVQNSALNFNHIFISAGLRGLQFQINPNDMIQITHATIADLIL